MYTFSSCISKASWYRLPASVYSLSITFLYTSTRQITALKKNKIIQTNPLFTLAKNVLCSSYCHAKESSFYPVSYTHLTLPTTPYV